MSVSSYGAVVGDQRLKIAGQRRAAVETLVSNVGQTTAYVGGAEVIAGGDFYGAGSGPSLPGHLSPTPGITEDVGYPVAAGADYVVSLGPAEALYAVCNQGGSTYLAISTRGGEA